MPLLGLGLAFGIDTTTAGQLNLIVTAVTESATRSTALISLGLTGLASARWRRTR